MNMKSEQPGRFESFGKRRMALYKFCRRIICKRMTDNSPQSKRTEERRTEKR